MPELHGCAVTGLGAVSALGVSCDALWAAVAAGRSGVRRIGRFSTAGCSVHIAGLVPGADVAAPRSELACGFATRAAREAWRHADAAAAGVAPERIAVVLGTSIGSHGGGLHRYAAQVAGEVGARGPCLTISTACSSSTNAIGLGRDLLTTNRADLVLAGGADELTPEAFAGFHSLGLLSPEPCAPFSERVGTTLGEGAGFVVIEPADRAARRGATPLAWIAGYGLSADAYHETGPDPSGRGVARAVSAALDDACLDPSTVDYVNAHGTGTAANDPAEWRALARVFGARRDEVLLSSSKSLLGHAQGAAGVLELIVTLLAMRQRVVPQTFAFERSRPHCPRDPVGQPRPRPAHIQVAVSTNSAFGGANAAIVIAAQPAAGRPTAATEQRPTRPIVVAGVGGVGPHGHELDPLARALAAGRALGGRVAPFRVERVARGVDPRGLDPSTCFLVAAAALALGDAGVRLRGRDGDRAGLVVGATALSAQVQRDYERSIEQRGLARASPAAFARMVLNAPTGAASLHLALRGPTSTLTSTVGSGLVAVVYAAELLRRHPATDLLVAGGVDELDDEAASGCGEGAACLVLRGGDARCPRGDASPMTAILAGWGLAGTGQLDEAISQALGAAGLHPTDVEGVFGHGAPVGFRGLPLQDPARAIGYAPAMTSVVGASLAVRELRHGRLRCALVHSHPEGTAVAAIVLRAQAEVD